MVTSDGYTITQDPKKNRIIINLPQTWSTINTTVSAVSDRKQYLTTAEEAVVLNLVKALFERGGQDETDKR